jgi:WD40 repeat protein
MHTTLNCMGGSVGRGKHKYDGAVKIYSRQLSSNNTNNTKSNAPVTNDIDDSDDDDVATDVASGGRVTLKLLTEFHDAKQWISDVKFSPDGKSLAVGAHDNGIYLYTVGQQFKRRAKFAKHNSYITHLDFTADSQRLRSNCGAYELLFSDANTGAQIGSASSLKDAQWSSSTCTLGWAVQGIWPPCADGTDVVSVLADVYCAITSSIVYQQPD